MRFALIALALTALFESVTVVLRFGFDLQSTRDTAALIGPLTGGIRIHHGYIGALITGIGMLLSPARSGVRCWILAIGLALIASDLLHHAVVLPLTTGDSGFDLTYPPTGVSP